MFDSIDNHSKELNYKNNNYFYFFFVFVFVFVFFYINYNTLFTNFILNFINFYNLL